MNSKNIEKECLLCYDNISAKLIPDLLCGHFICCECYVKLKIVERKNECPYCFKKLKRRGTNKY